jgi:hypothetical protein
MVSSRKDMLAETQGSDQGRYNKASSAVQVAKEKINAFNQLGFDAVEAEPNQIGIRLPRNSFKPRASVLFRLTCAG